MTSTTYLVCAGDPDNGIDSHIWERETKRGKYPKYCPEHTPAPIQHEQFRELFCVIGEHSWQWEVKRCRTPSSCPEHCPIVSTVACSESGSGLFQTLHCALGGHDWQWERKRGRKPENCPEHKPSVETKSRGDRSLRDSTRETITNILNRPSNRGCKCGITPDITLSELRTLNGGCTSPQFVCPCLDSIRRTINV